MAKYKALGEVRLYFELNYEATGRQHPQGPGLSQLLKEYLAQLAVHQPQLWHAAKLKGMEPRADSKAEEPSCVPIEDLSFIETVQLNEKHGVDVYIHKPDPGGVNETVYTEALQRNTKAFHAHDESTSRLR